MNVPIERHTCRSADGVEIVYSAAGAGEPALVFIHGGLADRSFWDAQLQAFAGKPPGDRAGPGGARRVRGRTGRNGDSRSSGRTSGPSSRRKRPGQVILFGNSLGGPMAIEAALLMPGRVLGVVGVDTFQSLDYVYSDAEALARAEAFRKDFAGSVKVMTRALFHRDADPALMADAERRMAKTSPEAMYEMFKSLGGYDQAAAARRLTVPLRAINGDLYPTDVAGVREGQGRFRRRDHEAHGPLPDARAPGRVQPARRGGRRGAFPPRSQALKRGRRLSEPGSKRGQPPGR